MTRVEVGGTSRSVLTVLCSSTHLQALGVRMALGRGFAPKDPAPGMVASHAYWRTALDHQPLAGATPFA